MEFMLDSANTEKLRYGIDHYPIVGVTTNPSILKKEGHYDLPERLVEIKKICGSRSMHVQLVNPDCEGMLKETDALRSLLGNDLYVKVPVTEEGLKAIMLLKEKGVNVTATAIYYTAQGLLAVAAGADYLAPYCNRMENNGINFQETISIIRNQIDRSNSSSKILAASFKNAGQVVAALSAGAHAVTVDPDVLRFPLTSPLVTDAIAAFGRDYDQLDNKMF